MQKVPIWEIQVIKHQRNIDMKQNLRIGFIGNFSVPHSTENDRKWSFEKLGHVVIPFQENETIVSDIYEMLPQLDVLFYSHTHGWKIGGLIELFQKCKEMGIPTASMHLDRWAWLEREKDLGQEATWFTEYLFMADFSPEAIKLYQRAGISNRIFWLKPGVVERDCYLITPDRQKYPYDIIFVGSKNYHPEHPFRPMLIDWLKKNYGDRFGHYGGDGLGTIRGNDLNTLYASAKIVVGDSCFGNRTNYWSDRVTETMGRGGFLLHPRHHGMGQMKIESYDYAVFPSLREKIEYFLENDQDREQIRIACHEWVKNNATYTHRAKEVLNVIFR